MSGSPSYACSAGSLRPLGNRLWVADVTYISTWWGWTYVAFVVDACARRIIGWPSATAMTAYLVLNALEQAVWTRVPRGVPMNSVVAHIDKGSQYAAICYTERLAQTGIVASTRCRPVGADRARAWIYPSTNVFDAVGPALLGLVTFGVMFLVTSHQYEQPDRSWDAALRPLTRPGVSPRKRVSGILCSVESSAVNQREYVSG